jgi:hypothetical protein
MPTLLEILSYFPPFYYGRNPSLLPYTGEKPIPVITKLSQGFHLLPLWVLIKARGFILTPLVKDASIFFCPLAGSLALLPAKDSYFHSAFAKAKNVPKTGFCYLVYNE